MLAPMVPSPMNPTCMMRSSASPPAIVEITIHPSPPPRERSCQVSAGKVDGASREAPGRRAAASIVLEHLDDGGAQDDHEQNGEEEDDHRHGQLRRQCGSFLL